jgi:glycosyltransferase involved in cell wall biosynthesis
MRRVRVVAFTKYGAEAASTRQRLLQYLPALHAAGIDVEWHALLGDDYVRALVGGTRPSRMAIARRYAMRMRQLAAAREADVLWVYAELFPYLPAAFERLAFTSGVPVIYDFDDAFFHQYDSASHPIIRHMLARKLEPLLRGAAVCVCGNAYLEEYARQFCVHTTVLPTVVDTDAYRPLSHRLNAPLRIGWIGTPSTWAYVRPLLPLLAELTAKHGIRVSVVGAGAAAEADRFDGLELIDWSQDTEISEVQRMDIGIMPLPDEAWARGKSGYKLIQYMACGLPVIASPVGVNAEIVVDGETGLLARDEAQWRRAITMLIGDGALRRRMGDTGRARAEAHYSLSHCAPQMVKLFRAVAGIPSTSNAKSLVRG